MTDLYCYSGGADGADLHWGRIAKANGFIPVHYTFPGHKTNARKEELFVLSDVQLRLANKMLANTAVTLEKQWPPGHAYVRKLLQRNYYQIYRTNSVYALTSLDDNGLVEGGTGWAVHSYINMQLNPTNPVRVYVYDIRRDRWFTMPNGKDGGWMPLIKPPRPTDSFTGIGTRYLSSNAIKAAEAVFE